MDPNETSEEPFDFARHKLDATNEYQKKRSLYRTFSGVIKTILGESLSTANIKVASIEERAKSIDSFAKKAGSRSPTNPNEPKYRNPIKDITDLAGIRVITFFPRTIDEVDRLINSEFEVLEKSDKSEILKEEERFGYQSIHYLVKLRQNRIGLTEYRSFDNLIAEIQVRTILQHAWAEIEHDIQYKSIEIIPTEIHRRFIGLAGLIEIADREFQAIQDADSELAQKVRDSINEGKLEDIEITPDAVRAYLDKKMGADGRMADWNYQFVAQMLRKLGFTNFSQIDDCISGYNDDQISRVIWDYRQGQIQRFEDVLLAGMGENFITRHQWNAEKWFTEGRYNRLKILRDAGVVVKDYEPMLAKSE
jgi:ppGpp synthetase/RelA/SpoT-type nucleotidyltranferase